MHTRCIEKFEKQKCNEISIGGSLLLLINPHWLRNAADRIEINNRDYRRSFVSLPRALASYFVIDGSYEIPISHSVASAAVICLDHVLLLQRAAQASQPLLWELPGGRAPAPWWIKIAAAAHKPWEESGLVENKVVDVIGIYERLKHEEKWKKFTILIYIRH